MSTHTRNTLSCPPDASNLPHCETSIVHTAPCTRNESCTTRADTFELAAYVVGALQVLHRHEQVEVVGAFVAC